MTRISSGRHRPLGLLLVGFTLIAGVGAVASPVPAFASPAFASPAPEPESAAVTVTLGSDASARAPSAIGPLTSGDLIVPGDARTWRIAVRSAAHELGMLTADIVDVRVTGAADAQFFDDFAVAGRPLSELVGKRTTIATQALPAGSSVVVPVGYEFARAARSGNHPPASAVTVRFDILFTLRGGIPPPTADPGHRLPFTGAGSLAALSVAFAVVLAGWWLHAMRRTRRRR